MRSLKVNTVSPTCLHGLLVCVYMLVALLIKLGDKGHNLIAINYPVAKMTDVLNVGRLALIFFHGKSFTFDCIRVEYLS